MEFKDIEYVCAVAEHKSITKAAESLFITQPTLSQYIKNMQRRLGIHLFSYEGNRILLTHEGELFVLEGMKLLRDRDILINSLNNSQKTGYGLLKLAIPLGRGSYLLPKVLPAFKALYPYAQIKLTEGSSRDLVSQVKEGFCDLVVINKPSFPLSIQYETLGYEKMLLVMSRESPYASTVSYNSQEQAQVRLSQLSSAPFILHQAYQHTGQIERCIFKHAGIKPRIILETKNLEASYRLAASGYGLTFLSEYHIHRIMQGDETINCQVEDPITNMELIVGYRQKGELSFLSKEFIRVLRSEFSLM